jgi:hypothetical protein
MRKAARAQGIGILRRHQPLIPRDKRHANALHIAMESGKLRTATVTLLPLALFHACIDDDDSKAWL